MAKQDFDPTGRDRPGKVIALHLGYESRAVQRGNRPAVPSFFLKPSTSVIASETPAERPAGTELLAFEGEIALIIGRPARNVDAAVAWGHVAWITAANDLGVYDLRWIDRGSNLHSKGGDGMLPLGPGLIDARSVAPDSLRLRVWVDGVLTQDDGGAGLVFPFTQLIADLAELITLEPGDVIITGTPTGSSVVTPGQTVEVEVDAPSAPGAPSTGRLVTPIVEGTVTPGRFGGGPKVDDAQRIDAWGSRAAAGLPPEFELTERLRDKLASVGVATLSAQLRKRGLDQVTIDGVHPLTPGTRLVGSARTLRFVPAREDLSDEYGGGYNAHKRAFDALKPGDVLVVEARGESLAGTIGDILALSAQVRGAAGFVSDGAVRDLSSVSALELPVFAAGAHPAVLGRRHVPWDVDLTIACGGTTVQPGDVIVGDDDGVIVIPPALVEAVVEDAIQQEDEERYITEQVQSGASIDGLYPLNSEWRARYESQKHQGSASQADQALTAP